MNTVVLHVKKYSWRWECESDVQILHLISHEAAGDGYAISEGGVILFIDGLVCKEGKWKQECILC